MSRRTGLQAVIFDWAGTTVDFGSMAPVAALQSVFAARGIEIGSLEARESMGVSKKDHIAAILASAAVRDRWRAMTGRPPSGEDVLELYAAFIPCQLECLREHSRLIPGVADAVEKMRSGGLKIGSTTGYNRPMLEFLLGEARVQGFAPDSSACPDDVGGGRPMPWMCYRNAIELKVYPLSACVKIGDTTSDIEEGNNAGMWTIGIAKTGNAVGLSEKEWLALPAAQQAARLRQARSHLESAGPHYVAGAVGDCEAILDEIDARIGHGEKP